MTFFLFGEGRARERGVHRGIARRGGRDRGRRRRCAARCRRSRSRPARSRAEWWRRTRPRPRRAGGRNSSAGARRGVPGSAARRRRARRGTGSRRWRRRGVARGHGVTARDSRRRAAGAWSRRVEVGARRGSVASRAGSGGRRRTRGRWTGHGVDGAGRLESEHLVDEFGVDAAHLGGLEQALPALERWLTDLGVIAAVVTLVEPGPPERVQLVERRRLGSEPDLDLERLLDGPVESLDDAAALADVRLRVRDLDAELGAAEVKPRTLISRSAVDVELVWRANPGGQRTQATP